MILENQLYSLLGDIASTYPNVAPEKADIPRITFQLIAGGDTPDYAGRGGGARYVRIQIDTWAATYLEARALSERARTAVYAGLRVGEVSDNPSDFELDTRLHRASFDVRLWA